MSELASFAILDLFEKLDNVSTNLFLTNSVNQWFCDPKVILNDFFKALVYFSFYFLATPEGRNCGLERQN